MSVTACTSPRIYNGLRFLGRRRSSFKVELERTNERLRRLAIVALDEGVSEPEVARLAGVSRRTVRVWASKEGWNPGRASGADGGVGE